jgi:pilus assembly protein Flp/PilA
MTTIASRIGRFLTSEDGPTAVEYAVMLTLITIGLVAVVSAIATNISGTFSTVNSSMGS